LTHHDLAGHRLEFVLHGLGVLGRDVAAERPLPRAGELLLQHQTLLGRVGPVAAVHHVHGAQGQHRVGQRAGLCGTLPHGLEAGTHALQFGVVTQGHPDRRLQREIGQALSGERRRHGIPSQKRDGRGPRDCDESAPPSH
jgi:hypothetical protein